MRIFSPIVVAACVGCATGSAAHPPESQRESIAISHQLDARDAGMTPEQLRTLVPRVAALQPDVDSLIISPGETFSALRFSARVLDSAGTTLGLLRRYDFTLLPGAATMESPPTVRGVREGVSLLRISFPGRLWVGRADAPPERFIRVIVRAR